MIHMSHMPRKRPADEFLVEKLDRELLVYDQVLHQAHSLTAAAALVWASCDGGPCNPVRVALAEAGHTESLEAVLAQLVASKLVASPPVARDKVNHSRRRMLSTTAVAAGVIIASPVVYSIISPSVAQAASCGGQGQSCCIPPRVPDCTVGVCTTGTCI